MTFSDSFGHLASWLEQVQNQSEKDVLVFLVGNKKDMEQDREVSVEKA